MMWISFNKDDDDMKTVWTILTMFLALAMTAQVGINTTAPNSSTYLDIQATDGGVLIPRVALTGTTDATTISNGNVEGLLVYNTVTVSDVVPGFYYWDGGSWLRFQTNAAFQGQVMMRNFTATGIGGSNTVFNFPNALFNNINGASYNAATNRIILPRGLYLIESDLRLNSNNTVDWNIRLDGNFVGSGVSGSANPAGFNTNASTIKQVTVVEVTAATGGIDFQVIGGSGATILNAQTHVLIQRLR